jgi:hypothetical protein
VSDTRFHLVHDNESLLVTVTYHLL